MIDTHARYTRSENSGNGLGSRDTKDPVINSTHHRLKLRARSSVVAAPPQFKQSNIHGGSR